MKQKLPRENCKKIRDPFIIGMITVLYLINDYIEIIKAKKIAFALCGILICIVLLKDTIYKCLDRLCKRDETIEREKTKRLLSKNDNNPCPDNAAASKNSNTQDNDEDVKIYKMKR